MPAGASVLILNGPNLNMLGVREPAVYGSLTLDDIGATCRERAAALGLIIDFRQSNSEGELVGWVQRARLENDGIVINAGGYSHTSIALLDALTLAELPIIEVHLTNIFRRETFRHHSYISTVAKGVICGLGVTGYLLALDAMASILEQV
ncbi:MAG: type II 3-dehydroquinate dehydratase [Rhodospirillaceae bacterium]